MVLSGVRKRTSGLHYWQNDRGKRGEKKRMERALFTECIAGDGIKNITTVQMERQ